MHTSAAKHAGGRVFRVDRECYVVYVGSDHHLVRPFLRIGTSPNVPDRIRPYIGTVVIADRLTGDLMQEAATVGPAAVQPNYTASQQMLAAVGPFLTARNVSGRSIDASRGREGAFVEFLTDGNLNVLINGRCIFDLAQRERDDRHFAYRLDRIDRIIESTAARYTADSLQRSGFLVGADRSLFLFQDGALEARALRPGGVLGLAERLISPRLLTAFSGPLDGAAFSAWSKWAVRRSGIEAEGATIRMVGVTPDSGGLLDLVAVLQAVGLAVEHAAPRSHDAFVPAPLLETAGASLETAGASPRTGRRAPRWPQIDRFVLPAGAAWARGTAPPLLTGVPYRIDPGHAVGADTTLERFLQDGRGAHGELARLLQGWNDGSAIAAGFDPAKFSAEFSRQLTAAPLPVLADIRSTERGYDVQFSIQEGYTVGNAAEQRRAIERIAAIAAAPDEQSLFRNERQRLVRFLDDLLRQRRSTLRAETTPKPPTAPPDRAGAGDAPRSRSDAAPEDRSGGRGTDRAAPGGRGSNAAGERSTARGGSRRAVSTRARAPRRGLVAAALLALVVLVGGAGYFVLRERSGRTTPTVALDERGANGAAPNADRSANPREPDERGANGAAPNAAESNASRDPNTASATEPGAGASNAAESNAPRDPNTARAEGSSATDSAAGASNAAQSNASRDPDIAGATDSAAGTPAETQTLFTNELKIGMLDILVLANEIAQLNDFAPIGDNSVENPDPNWIFPSMVFTLLEERRYEILRGDTIWGIAERMLDRALERERAQLADLLQRMENGRRPIEELEALIETSYIASVRRKARDLIQRLQR